EQGLRRILNFGHTIGHAIETAMDYQISHGFAIAIGMFAEAFISFRLNYLAKSELEIISEVLEGYHFPLQLPSNIIRERWLENMQRDKKATAMQPRCVILGGIGSVISFGGGYCTCLSDEVLKETFEWMKGRSLCLN